MRFLTILLILSPVYACEPVELIETRQKLHQACLTHSISEYTCNNLLRALRVIEQDADIVLSQAQSIINYKQVNKTLKLKD